MFYHLTIVHVLQMVKSDDIPLYQLFKISYLSNIDIIAIVQRIREIFLTDIHSKLWKEKVHVLLQGAVSFFNWLCSFQQISFAATCFRRETIIRWITPYEFWWIPVNSVAFKARHWLSEEKVIWKLTATGYLQTLMWRVNIEGLILIVLSFK